MKVSGNRICDVLVILEPSNQSVSEFVVSESGKILISTLKEAGVNLSKVSFIIPAPEIPRDIKKIEKAAKEFVLARRAEFIKIFNTFKPKALLYVAKYAALQVFGRSVKAGDFEGIIRKVHTHDYPIIGCTSIRNAALYKDSISLVKAQILMLRKLVENNYEYNEELFKFENTYEWRVDISDVLKNKPKTIAFDTETTGLDWKVDRPIVYQMTFAEGHSILSPVCESYFPEYFKETFGDFSYDALRDQWKQIIEDPEIRKVGHNIKFDMHMALNLGHRLRGLYIDTLQMLWSIDENMPSKGLDNAVKIFVPELAGYADNFNRETDKGQMITVHPKDMIDYAGGDTDATFRLCKTLIKIAKEDPSNLKVFSKVKMRAIETFFDMERTGVRVDVNYFDSISKEYLKHLKEESVEIIKLVPPKIRRKYMFGKKSETKEPLRLGNKEMMRDAIFSEDGLGIIPIPDKGYEPSSKTKEVKIPSIAVNTHLKFFKEQGYELIDRYCDYSKISKMSDTYTGDREKLTGLWQHIKFNEETGEYRIHPTYDIHTNTGRCLTGDTLVTVKQGRKTTTKRLDQIVVGDLTLTHKQRYMPVTKIFKNGKKEVYGVCLDNGSVLRGTLKHKLMLESGEFKQIQHLDYTDRLMTYTDGEFKGSKVNSFYYKKNDLVETFDIEVEEDHSYVANGIVSHNSNCKRPNMQNPPSKGDLAVQFKKSIITSDGFVLLAADYSQMELRCIAIAAKEKVMQQIYNEGLDIHAKTAAEVLLKITLEEFRNIDSKLRKVLRNKAKAIIFGFMYGLLPKGFVVYAKLLYDADFTLEEAEIIRETLLTQTYPGLQQWHTDTKEFANEHGYVKALHGSTRHLPAIHSHDKWVKLEAERYSVNCVDDKTECLTKNGWKTVYELNEGDLIATKNKDTGYLEYQPIKKLNKAQYKGEMHLIETKTMSACTTPNHRWLVYDKHRKKDLFVYSSDLSMGGMHKIHIKSKGIDKDTSEWTDDEVRLIGWFLTDGYIRKSYKNGVGSVKGTIAIVQSARANPRKCALIFAIFNRLGMKYRCGFSSMRTMQLNWSLTGELSKRIIKALPDRTLTTDFMNSLSTKQVKLLVKYMLLGDGTKKDKPQYNTMDFSCGTKEKADMFSHLCCLAGIATSITWKDMEKYTPISDKLLNIPKSKGVYNVTVKSREYVHPQYGFKKSYGWEGLVWCPTVDNGCFYARRNGKQYITGNSPIQEFGSDMGLMAFDYIMRDMSRDNIRPINFIHDALYFEVRKELAVEYASYVKWYMENVPIARDFGIVSPIPFVADPDLGVNWADVFTLAELELETKDKNKDFKLFCKEFNVTKEQASKYFCYNKNDIKMVATRPDFCTI